MPDEINELEKNYKAGLSYHREMGFTSNWPVYERFKTGDQWPAPTERTKNLPRPVFNIVQFITDHKKSSILQENVKMTFSPEEVPADQDGDNVINPQEQQIMNLALEGAEKFSQYSETVWSNVDQDALNEQALDDASSLGSGIWHYYWDDNIEGGIITKYKGDMAGEVLDPSNVFFGNPQCKDVQKQPWIIISGRELVSTVKEIAQSKGVSHQDIAKITPDKNVNDELYDSAKKELIDSDKTTTLTMYYKKTITMPTDEINPLTLKPITKQVKKVFFKKAASGVIYQPETDLGEGTEQGFTVYPIEIMSWKSRKKCIYGIGETEGIIPNQKAINFNIAMLLLSVQETAWPKMLAKIGALNQSITNTPGEIIYDHHDGQGDGIKFMETGKISEMSVVLTDKVTELTRIFSGVNEVSTGEPFTGDLNASAIIALQNQAKIPIDQIRKSFYRSLKRIGRIWEEFFKVKYNITRKVSVKDVDGNEVPIDFNGSQYADIPYKLKIDIGTSSQISEPLTVASIDKFLDKGFIDFMTALDLYPATVVPFKDRLIKKIQQQQEQNNIAIQQFIAQLPQEVQQIIIQAMQGGLQQPPPNQQQVAS